MLKIIGGAVFLINKRYYLLGDPVIELNALTIEAKYRRFSI